MRIIAGEHRSRRIIPPADEQTTRPITDRVKVALFDRLWSLGALAGQHALDLFAGTGSLGLECLSRGVARCTFVERNRDSRSRLEENLKTLQLADRATVLGVDALALGYLRTLPRPAVDLVTVDPPYALVREHPDRIAALLEAVAEVAAPAATLVLRTDAETPAPPSPAWGDPETRPYGSMTLHFFQRAAGPPMHTDEVG